MLLVVDSKIKIVLSELSKEILDKIKNDLYFPNPEYDYHVRAKNYKALHVVPPYIYGFQIYGGTIFIERVYLYTLLSYLKKYHIPYSVKYKYNVNGTDWFNEMHPVQLRDYQVDAKNALLNHKNGILVMPCGSGKTITLLETIRETHQWSLVIVHTQDLLNQWKSYIYTLYGKECGIIQGNNIDIKPLTIAMMQTLSHRELTKRFLNLWGVVILDEAHHSPAETFTEVMNKFPAKYRYGATATVKRSDNLEALLFLVCGFPRYRIGFPELEKLGYLVKPRVVLVETNHFASRRYHNYAQVVSSLIKDRDRCQLIVTSVLEHREHFNLVLSNRIEHLEILYDMYKQHDNRCALLVASGDSSVNQEERKHIIESIRVGNIHTIFATQLADEGLDIPRLDRVFFTVSSKALGSIEQRIGRIQRVFPGKTDAIVFDFCDSMIPMLNNHLRKRLQLYEELGLNVEGSNYEIARYSNTVVRFEQRDRKITGFKRRVAKFTNK